MSDKKKCIITAEMVLGHLHCARKGFLLASVSDQGVRHGYEQVIAEQRDSNLRNYFNALKKNNVASKAFCSRSFDGGEKYLKDAFLRSQDLEARCDLLTNVADKAERLKIHYEPTVISGLCKTNNDDKVKLAFAGHVLSLMQAKPPKAGFIVGMDQSIRKVNLDKHYKSINRALQVLKSYREKPSEAPPIVIKKHCAICQFRQQCFEQAEKDDNLSLLDRITPKNLAKYHKKGVFTIKQLSFLFRQRRVRKKRKNAAIRFSPELQAMAIRTGKIYVQAPPKLAKKDTELFFDIEGIPDQDFHYLFGVLVIEQGKREYFKFWADDKSNERAAWNDLLQLLSRFPNAPIYHYGSYEIRALDVLAKRYSSNLSTVTERLVNVNGLVFGKIYFPVRSNSLKAIGKFIGATWTDPEASGIQSLVWRHKWEQLRSAKDMERLITYNKEDCSALSTLVETISLADFPDADPKKFDFADNPKRDTTDTGSQIHRHFEHLLKSAWADYDKNKISLRQLRDAASTPLENPKKKVGGVVGHKGTTRIAPKKVGKIVALPSRRHCQEHQKRRLVVSEKIVTKTVIDLRFSKNGCRKVITRYVGHLAKCPKCHRLHGPPDLEQFGRSGSVKFGHSFQAWVVYQRVILRLPLSAIRQTIGDLFGEQVSKSTVTNFMNYMATQYDQTQARIEKEILESPFIHADETKINIQGVNHYVWVFTDGRHVIFKLTETRESDLVQKFLSTYRGVLISDFYPGYDSIECKQQKCWVHLIRDLNDDLWEQPYNMEFENFVFEVKTLIEPIFQAIEKYGLKKRNLNKFRSRVDQFYEQNIINRDYKSEATVKFQKRFHKHRNALFVFLTMDSIPWNNNMAERAIRHLAVQRKISGYFFKKGAVHYLSLLGIGQTCRFQGKSFLKFLLSGEPDVDAFKASKKTKIILTID